MTQYRSRSRLSVRGRQGPISHRNGYSAHRPVCPAGSSQIGAGTGIIGHSTRHETPGRPGWRDNMKWKVNGKVRLNQNNRAIFSGDFTEDEVETIATFLEKSKDTFRLVGLLNLIAETLKEIRPQVTDRHKEIIDRLLEIKDALV